jgi:hypothetical protein
MADRGAEEIRREIAVERRRLEDSRAALLAELRSFVPSSPSASSRSGSSPRAKGFAAA